MNRVVSFTWEYFVLWFISCNTCSI